MDKRLKDYYDGLFSPEEEPEVQKWLALHGKDEFVSDSLRELFDGEEKCSGDSSSDTRNYNFPISVPPYCRIVAEAIVARYQLNVGYTTYLRSVNTGKEIRLEGRWRGIDCAEIKAKCTEYELDSNNITKIKTFNGVPHEAVVL